MGTHGLYIVIYNGKHIVYQYGQFDAYPDGHGLNVLDFIHFLIADETRLQHFKAQLDRCVRITPEYYETVILPYGESLEIPLTAQLGPLSLVENTNIQLFYKKYASMNCELSSEIFKYIYQYENNNQPIMLWHVDSDDLYDIEWTYTIDLDHYQFQIEGLEEICYNFDELPDDVQFLRDCNGEEDTEDEDDE